MKNCPECSSKLFKTGASQGVLACSNDLCRKVFHILEIRVMPESEHELKKKKFNKEKDNESEALDNSIA